MATPVLMLMNMKGGVGKTTLAVELSRTLAHAYDKDVLLVDYDPQSNASLAFLTAGQYSSSLSQGKSVADCLMPDQQPTDPFSVVGSIPGSEVDSAQYAVNVRRWYYRDDPNRKAGRLDLIPGNLELMRLALNVLQNEAERRLLHRWDGLIASSKKLYDCIVIDCHPAGSFFTKSALLASDAVIIPVTSDNFAATGLNMMRRHMEMWQPSGGAKEFLVIFNDANRSWDSSVEYEIRGNDRFADHCLSNRIGYSALLRNLPKRHRTAVEQRVANRWRVGANVSSVTEEMVNFLTAQGIFDDSWR